jgi:hypothetical protein
MLHGRGAECDALERLLDDARRSRSGVLVVRGEAGVGKSALLGHAADRADGMAVLRASVVPVFMMVNPLPFPRPARPATGPPRGCSATAWCCCTRT